jgi:RNA polymerase sigma-70 factor (sigma-E family)
MRRVTRQEADAAFVEFMTAAQPSLLRLAYFLTGSQDQAKELTQEALVRVYVKWPRIEQDAALAYSRRVLVNLRIDRGRQSVREVASATLPDVAAASDRSVGEQDEMVTMLRSLPERQRKIVVLRYCCDLSERDVAEMLHISVGGVKSQSSRGLAALRALPMATEGGRS